MSDKCKHWNVKYKYVIKWCCRMTLILILQQAIAMPKNVKLNLTFLQCVFKNSTETQLDLHFSLHRDPTSTKIHKLETLPVLYSMSANKPIKF